MAYRKELPQPQNEEMMNEETTIQQAWAELKQLVKMQAKEYLTIGEAAQLYDMDENLIKSMIKDCRLHAHRGPNGNIYVRKGDFCFAMFGEPLLISDLAQLKL